MEVVLVGQANGEPPAGAEQRLEGDAALRAGGIEFERRDFADVAATLWFARGGRCNVRRRMGEGAADGSGGGVDVPDDFRLIERLVEGDFEGHFAPLEDAGFTDGAVQSTGRLTGVVGGLDIEDKRGDGGRLNDADVVVAGLGGAAPDVEVEVVENVRQSRGEEPAIGIPEHAAFVGLAAGAGPVEPDVFGDFAFAMSPAGLGDDGDVGAAGTVRSPPSMTKWRFETRSRFRQGAKKRVSSSV
ncbi:MAG: hypothetical protein R3B90_19825 [Planctomycetaceae bacterium]